MGEKMRARDFGNEPPYDQVERDFLRIWRAIMIPPVEFTLSPQQER